MTDFNETIAARIDTRFGERIQRVSSVCGELTYELSPDDIVEVAAEGFVGFRSFSRLATSRPVNPTFLPTLT